MTAIAMGAFPALAAAQTLSVKVEAGPTPRAILHGAEEEAAKIFAASGIAIRWIDSGNASVTLHVIASPDLERPSFTPVHFGGFAMMHFARVVAVRPAGDQIAAPVWIPIVIGRMIAHELGHALGEHHAPHSIMNPTLDKGGNCTEHRCRFTTEQTARLRAAIQETR